MICMVEIWLKTSVVAKSRVAKSRTAKRRTAKSLVTPRVTKAKTSGIVLGRTTFDILSSNY